MKIIHVVLVSAAFLLSGCFGTAATKADENTSVVKTVTKPTGETEVTEQLTDYAIYAKSVGTKQPLFDMSCPDSGCVMKSLKVYAPDSGGKLAGPPKGIGTTLAEGVVNIVDKTIDKAAGAVPFVAAWKVLDKAFDAASGKTITTNIDSSNRSSTDNSNRSTTTDTSNRSTTTDNSNRSTNNSNNRNCQTGAPAGTTGQTGSSGPANC